MPVDLVRRTAIDQRGVWEHWRGKVLASCPQCGGVAVLDHAVAADGTVSPSMECPYAGCEFHESVRLVGWEVASN